MSTIITANLQASGGTGTAATLASINGGPLAGLRNRIINGNFGIWQRGTSTTATGDTYLADRWMSAFSTGGTVSQETSSLPAGSRYAWKFVASASNSFMQFGQQIEFANCLDLQNSTVSISFMARSVNSNAGSTALIVRSRTIAGTDGVCLFTGASSNSSITLTTAWTRYTVTRTLPATFGSLSIEFALGSHVSGDGVMFSQIQLEPGTVATPFERRPIGTELALCQRYFCKTRSIFRTYQAAGEFLYVHTLPVQMRAQPTATVLSTSGSSGPSSIAIYSNGYDGQSVNIGVTTAGTGFAYAVTEFTASAEL